MTLVIVCDNCGDTYEIPIKHEGADLISMSKADLIASKLWHSAHRGPFSELKGSNA